MRTHIASVMVVLCLACAFAPQAAMAEEAGDQLMATPLSTMGDSADATEVSTAAALDRALRDGASSICVVGDFELDRTLYISRDVTLYSKGAHTITRAADFDGDLFVVGESRGTENAISLDRVAALTLGQANPASGDRLTIDGNRDNMTVPVEGSVLFVCYSAAVNVHDDVSIVNCYKGGNNRTAREEYNLPYTDRIGGAVAIIANGSMNIYGGTFANNGVNTEETTAADGTELRESTMGGAVFNFSNLNIYGGTFEGNRAARGGAVYNYRQVNVDGGTFRGNYAEVYGGAVYQAASQFGELVVGRVDGKSVLFEGNESPGSGGAVFSQTKNAIVIYANTTFRGNKSGSNGGAIYTTGTLTIKQAAFEGNEATSKGGAIYVSKKDLDLTTRFVSVENATFKANKASRGGAVGVMAAEADYEEGGIASFAHCTFEGNQAVVMADDDTDTYGGAIYVNRHSRLTATDCVLKDNSAAKHGGALYLTGSSEATLKRCEFQGNTAASYGGGAYFTGAGVVTMYSSKAVGNSAKNGGFLYITMTGTTVTVAGLVVSGNTATAKGPIIYGNTTNATLNIDKGKYRDLEVDELDAEYWAGAIVNKLTVNEVTVEIPADEEVLVPSGKDPVSVEAVFALEDAESDASINETYDGLPRLENQSNFMSRATARYEGVNGKDVAVDTFVYHADEAANNPNVGEGLLIYQAMLYKRAHPGEDVSIAISSFHFSSEAAICLNRNSRYFGYMRNLGDADYDEHGFVRISYLLVAAAKMGVNVTVIGQIEAYPRTDGAPGFDGYFTSQLGDPCDPAYANGKMVGDFLKFRHVLWTSYGDDAASDMMHTKLCAVSNYLDANGVEHSGSIWLSSINLDGVQDTGVNGNNGMQTAALVSDHDELYRVSANYLRLISDYSGQEDVYLFRDLVGRMNTEQIDLINAGHGGEIPADQQIVYLGSASDDVFELYFAPFGGDCALWDEARNPYCKFLRKMEQSDGSIAFAWNNPTFNKNFTLSLAMEDLITRSFHDNKNALSRIYIALPNFDSAGFDDLEVGRDIGYKSFGQYVHGGIHNKDVQVSYNERGKRMFVTLLSSMNMHQGAMSYQSNHVLVVKEPANTSQSVFRTMADLTAEGIADFGIGGGQGGGEGGGQGGEGGGGNGIDADGVAMFRLYNPYSGEHHYTSNADERDAAVAAGWLDEGVGWTAPVESDAPVYRLYNPFEPLGDHHYTTDWEEYDACVAAGWVGEEVGWYSADAAGVPLYREYNPNAYAMGMTGAHHYTADKEEADGLTAIGWIAEDVAWYGL